MPAIEEPREAAGVEASSARPSPAPRRPARPARSRPGRPAPRRSPAPSARRGARPAAAGRASRRRAAGRRARRRAPGPAACRCPDRAGRRRSTVRPGSRNRPRCRGELASLRRFVGPTSSAMPLVELLLARVVVGEPDRRAARRPSRSHGETSQPAARRSSSGNAVSSVRPFVSTRATASPSRVIAVSIVPVPSSRSGHVTSASTLQPASTSRQATSAHTRVNFGTTLHYRRAKRVRNRHA